MDNRLNQNPADMSSEFAQTQFQIKQTIMKMAGATIVQVKAVNTTAQTVDIHPLVDHVDAFGNVQKHSVVSACPYFRLQAGASAIIVDPIVGDIGIAIFAQRDISSVIATKKSGSPASARIWDMSDGLYFGGILNPVPTQFMRMDSTGINITSTVKVTVNAPSIVAGNGGALNALVNSTLLTWLNGHVHASSGAGVPTTTVPTTTLTTILQAQ